MSAHIIGRPDDDLLDILIGHGAEPEQAFIDGRYTATETRSLERNPKVARVFDECAPRDSNPEPAD